MDLAAPSLAVVSTSPRQSTCIRARSNPLVARLCSARQYAQSLQHPLRSCRELVNVAATPGERIGHCASDRAKRTDDRALAAALETAQSCRRRVGVMHLDPRNFERRGYEIVGQRDGARLAGLLVIDKLLKERLADALRDPSDDLSLDHRRIDDGADVFGSNITHDLDFTGLRVDIDHGDMGAACEAAEFWIVERGDFEARVKLRRNILGGKKALHRH